jgi:hypothetical protein
MWAMRKTRRLIGGRATTFDHSFITFSLSRRGRRS